MTLGDGVIEKGGFITGDGDGTSGVEAGGSIGGSVSEIVPGCKVTSCGATGCGLATGAIVDSDAVEVVGGRVTDGAVAGDDMIGAADGAIAGDSVVRAAGDGVLPRRTAGDSVTGDAGGGVKLMEGDTGSGEVNIAPLGSVVIASAEGGGVVLSGGSVGSTVVGSAAGVSVVGAGDADRGPSVGGAVV